MKECVYIGKKDISLIQYYEDRNRYADLINGYFFHGQQIVHGEDIKELDSRTVGLRKGSGIKGEQFSQIHRDMVRKAVFGVNFMVIALENQDKVHYGMPIRIMHGDALAYHRQMKEVQRRHKKQKDYESGTEFLGEFFKEDRIPAVVSLVIYYGKEPWDGARDLYELLDLSMIPGEMQKLINHYPIHILEVRQFEHTERFQTDVREVFEFIRSADDKEKLKEFVELRKDRLANLPEDACDVITAIANTKGIPLKGVQYRNEEGGIDMCKALEDWRKEIEEESLQRGQQQGIQQGIQQGMEQGIQQGMQQGILQGLQMVSAVLFQYGMSTEEIAQKYGVALEHVRSWYEEWMKSVSAA